MLSTTKRKIGTPCELFSFAAITDEPPSEVAAVGPVLRASLGRLSVACARGDAKTGFFDLCRNFLIDKATREAEHPLSHSGSGAYLALASEGKRRDKGSLMKYALKSTCILAAGIGAFWSGLFWHLSALAQLKALSVQATSGAAAVQRMLVASAHNNLWAAYGAMVAGVALFLLLFFKDKGDAG